MYTIEAMDTLEPKPHPNISLRLSPEEFPRYVEVLRRARNRNPLADKTRIIRELLGLGDYSLLSLEDKAYFKGKEGEVPIFLGDKEREIIEGLASKESRPFADQARELILEALMQRKLIASTVEQSDVAYIADYLPKPVRLKLLGEIAAGEPIDIYPRSESIDVPGYKLKAIMHLTIPNGQNEGFRPEIEGLGFLLGRLLFGGFPLGWLWFDSQCLTHHPVKL